MANHKSALKRSRQTIVKTKRNTIKKTLSRGVVKKLREAISKKDKAVAAELLPTAQKYLARLAKAGILKGATAGRRTSRLASQVAAL